MLLTFPNYRYYIIEHSIVLIIDTVDPQVVPLLRSELYSTYYWWVLIAEIIKSWPTENRAQVTSHSDMTPPRMVILILYYKYYIVNKIYYEINNIILLYKQLIHWLSHKIHISSVKSFILCLLLVLDALWKIPILLNLFI